MISPLSCATHHVTRRQPGLFSLVAAFFCACFFAPSTPAQTTGAISGRVQNAVSGSALNLARVTVVDTGREVFTNEFGEFQLSNVPPGPVRLRFQYTGLEPKEATVQVAAGQTVTQDVELSIASMGDTVQLAAFTVSSQRDTNATSIAANEQRYSPNLKNVVSSDAFGDVTEGNVGEFMKFLPGVSVDYVAADVRTMSVRGFADNFTSISVNGARMASSASGSGSRSFEFEQVSINNIARIELTKAPTPSMPADSLGGAVNMIAKNAFERSKAELRYRAYLSFNSEDLDLLKKTPGPMQKSTYKVLPGFDFDYTLPVNKTFGIVVTGLTSNQFNEQHRSQMAWNFAQAGATPANPYLQQYQFQDGPKNTFRDSFSIKADWKATPEHVLSATVQANYYLSQFGNRNITFNAGTTATSTPAGGAALTYTPTGTSGATGRGTVQGQTSFRDKYGATTAGVFTWNFNGADWKLDATLNASKSRTWYRDTGRDHFSEVRTNMNNVSRVIYEGIDGVRPASIRVLNAAGAELDPTLLGNYTVTFGRGNPIDASDMFTGADLNAKRELGLPFRAALKGGLSLREQIRNIRRWDESWNLAGTVNGAQYLDRNYVNQSPYWGLPNQEWPDAYALYDVFQATPSAFAQTAAQQVAAERFRRQNSQYLTETVSAAYLQAEARFLNNRLSIVTGVRYEKTEDDGRGPKTLGPIATIEQLQTNLVERGYRTSKSYDGYYPSFHANYNITDDTILRVAYARTLGRPDFANILPLARVNNTSTNLDDGLTPTIPPLTVIVTNSALQPWHSDGYDVSLEHYFPKGGIASVGVFRKDLSDFWGTANRSVTDADVTEFNLEPSDVGLALQTSINVGRARISGVEVNFQQPLNFLPGIGKNLSVFVNGTKLRLQGPNSADFAKFIEQSASYGITFSRAGTVVSLKWNFRGEQRLAPQTGAQYGTTTGFYEYYAPRTFLDVNGEFGLSKRFTIFANARNVMNKEQTLRRFNANTPDYAKTYRIEKFGVQLALGLKGKF